MGMQAAQIRDALMRLVNHEQSVYEFNNWLMDEMWEAHQYPSDVRLGLEGLAMKAHEVLSGDADRTELDEAARDILRGSGLIKAEMGVSRSVAMSGSELRRPVFVELALA